MSSYSSLIPYGYTESWDQTFTDVATGGTVPGRVLRAERNHVQAITPEGPLTVMLTHGGSHAHATGGLTPTTGDWISLFPATQSSGPILDVVLPRTTTLARSGAAADSYEQVLAANIDTVIIAVSLADPLRHARTERLLALAWASGATPVLALTKADAHENPAQAAAEVEAVAPGAAVVPTSSLTGDGLDVLRAVVSGTMVLIGTSGAGKSSLGNALLGEDLLTTGDVRSVDGKGRHTTAWRELLPIPGGGVLLDTPGLRSVGITSSDEAVSSAFPEVEALAAECRFADCQHDAEPGCAVQAAIASGQLDARRLESYRKLSREALWVASRTDARLRAERLRGYKAQSRQFRGLNKDRGR